MAKNEGKNLLKQQKIIIKMEKNLKHIEQGPENKDSYKLDNDALLIDLQ